MLSPVELTRELVRADTINPPGNEARLAPLLKELLEDCGCDVEVIEPEPGRTNLIARLEGRDPKRLPICFTGHLDVVPLGTAKWSRDPLGGDVEDGFLYGRGSSDMKGGLAAMVCAARAIAELPDRSAGALFVFTAGEETGCDGVRLMIERGLFRERAGALVVGEPTSLRPVVAHKGALWTKIVCSGKAAHGSMPELGDNAILKMLPILARLAELDLGPADPLQGAPTLNVAMLSGGTAPNQVPDRCEAIIDIRTVSRSDREQIFAQLVRAVGPKGRLERLLDLPPVSTPASVAWIERSFEIAEQITRQKARPSSSNYFTDAALLKPALGDPPAILCGPGAPEQAHQTDERVEVRMLDLAVDFYTALGADWCR